MKFGLYLPNQAGFADVGKLAQIARGAEGAGWEGVFLWDALLPMYDYAMGRSKIEADGDLDWEAVADPIVALTAMAAATSRIRLGVLVHAVSRQRPEVFAQQTATLDRFSGGRLIVGVGLGNPSTQFSAFGHEDDVKVRAGQVDEFLDLVVELWSGRVVEFEGRWFTARGVALPPAPAQQPRIPIWIGADSANRAPRRRGARWDGYVPASTAWPTGVISVEEYRSIQTDLHAWRTADTPIDIVLIGNREATVPAPADLAGYAEAGVTWLLVQAITLDDAAERIRTGPPPSP